MSSLKSRLKQLEKAYKGNQKENLSNKLFLINLEPFNVSYKYDLSKLKHDLKVWFKAFSEHFKELNELHMKRNKVMDQKTLEDTKPTVIYDDIALYVSLKKSFPHWTEEEVKEMIDLLIYDSHEKKTFNFIKTVYAYCNSILEERRRLRKIKWRTATTPEGGKVEIEIPQIQHVEIDDKEKRKQEILKQLKELEGQ